MALRKDTLLLSKLSGGDFTEWDRFLPSVQLGLNARISSGPYEIVNSKGGAYTVKDAAGTIHTSLITPKFIKVIKSRSVNNDDEASYEVEKILEHRGAGEKENT